MKVRIEEIKEKGLVLDSEEAISGYDSLVELEEAGECRFLKPLHVHLDIKKGYGHIRVEGNIASAVRLTCARCLTEFDYAIDSSFTIIYTKNAGLPQDEEVELSEKDLVSATYSDDEIDFTSEIAEQVILEVPIKPMCRENCRGLCDKCGADLNLAECGCDRQDFNFKFSALKDFKVDR